MAEKKAHFEIVAEKLLEEMKKGTSIFQKPWKDDLMQFPYNPTTSKNYRGMNNLWLMMQGFNDPRWLTFKQAQAEGYKVKKGAKGTQITYFSFEREVVKKDAQGKPILDKDGNKIKQLQKLPKPIISSAYVFNAEQIDGIPKIKQTEGQTWKNSEEVEKLLISINLQLKLGGNRAFYSPSRDIIVMPNKNQFQDEKGYYSTLLHELGHWTGHKDRLDRFDNTNSEFGSEGYALEELRAEISSLMLGAKYGVGKDLGQHVSYIQSWIKVLENDPFELYKASADAQGIVDYIQSLQEKQTLKVDNSIEKYDNSKVLYVTEKLENLGFSLDNILSEKLEREIFEGKKNITLNFEENDVAFTIQIKNTDKAIDLQEIGVTNLLSKDTQVFNPNQNFTKENMIDLIKGKAVEALLKNEDGTQKFEIKLDFTKGNKDPQVIAKPILEKEILSQKR